MKKLSFFHTPLEYKRNYSAHPDINTVICDSSNKSCEEDKKGIRNGTF